HVREETQEVERAQPRLARGALEVDGLVRVRVDPQRGVDGTAAVACAGTRRLVPPARDHLDHPRREEEPDLVEAGVAASLGRPPAAAPPPTPRRGGAAPPPPRPPAAPPPIDSASSGASWKDRHSSPQPWSWVQTYSSPGWPTRIEPATSSNDSPRTVYPKLP